MTTKKESFVSVIVIFKNEERFIRDCVNSILSQSHKNFELILYDDGSNDNSTNIIRNFKDKRIKYYKNKLGRGIAVTRNNALKKTEGSTVFFTDADCIVSRDWVAQGIRSLAKDCLGVEGRTDYITKKTTLADKVVESKTGSDYMTCNICYKASILKKINGFNTDFGNMMEDRELAFRVMKYGTILFNPKMKVTHQRKFWTFRGMISRFKEQGKTKVLMHKLHGDKKYITGKVAFPTHLVSIIFPPLLIIKAVRDRIKSFSDFKVLLYFYVCYIVERVSIWRTSIKKGDFIL